jgi:hypothetical protein
MNAVRALAVAVVVAHALAGCRSARAPEPTGASAPTGPWTWTASMGGPWRLPAYGYDVVVVPGDAHAIVRTSWREAVVVDLATGAVGPIAPLVTGAVVEQLARVGDRVLALGARDGAPAAWSISVGPLAATPIDLAPVPAGKPAKGLAGIAVSPDGSRLFVCSGMTWPVLRDAQTLAAVKVFEQLDLCREPVFSDDTHVLFKTSTPVLLDLTTGATLETSAKGPYRIAGPNGRGLTVTDYSKWQFSDGTGQSLGSARGYGHPRWLADGSGVYSTALGALSIQPVGGDARKIALPMAGWVSRAALTASGGAVLLSGYVMAAVDLATGAIRTADGNVGMVSAVAPRGGLVIAASDRVRAWGPAGLVANGEAGVVAFTAAPVTEPVITLSATTIARWEPVTGDRVVIRELEDLASTIDRAGDRVVYDDGPSLFQSVRGRPPSRWFRFRDDLILAAIDIDSDRVAWTGDQSFHVADLDRGAMWSFCSDGNRLVFDPDPARARAGVDDSLSIQLYDLAERRALGGVELDDRFLGPWAFLPGADELVIASEHDVVVWKPGANTALAWATGDTSDPSALAIDPTGAELAIGYNDGGVRWIDLRRLREHMTPRAATVLPPPPVACADATWSRLDYDDLVTGGGDDLDAPTDQGCDDFNDDPADDCAEIYGTPGDVP